MTLSFCLVISFESLSFLFLRNNVSNFTLILSIIEFSLLTYQYVCLCTYIFGKWFVLSTLNYLIIVSFASKRGWPSLNIYLLVWPKEARPSGVWHLASAFIDHTPSISFYQSSSSLDRKSYNSFVQDPLMHLYTQPINFVNDVLPYYCVCHFVMFAFLSSFLKSFCIENKAVFSNFYMYFVIIFTIIGNRGWGILCNYKSIYWCFSGQSNCEVVFNLNKILHFECVSSVFQTQALCHIVHLKCYF